MVGARPSGKNISTDAVSWPEKPGADRYVIRVAGLFFALQR
jgi:hypothetical protein